MKPQPSAWTTGALIAFLIAALAAIPYLDFPASILIVKFIVNWAIYTVFIAALVGIYRAIRRRLQS
jgi:hypothetical protein